MGSVSTEDRTGHIYLQQDISGEFTKVLAGSNHDSVNTFLEHLFDLYTKASKTTQAVVVREDVAQKFTALQCETRFQTSDDLMKHLLHLHVDYLKNSNNDIAKQTPREKTNPRKSRKSQPKRNIKHVTESDESCDLVKTNGNDDPWSDRSAASSRESTAECTDRMVDLSRVKEEITDTDKVIKSEQADKDADRRPLCLTQNGNLSSNPLTSGIHQYGFKGQNSINYDPKSTRQFSEPNWRSQSEPASHPLKSGLLSALSRKHDKMSPYNHKEHSVTMETSRDKLYEENNPQGDGYNYVLNSLANSPSGDGPQHVSSLPASPMMMPQKYMKSMSYPSTISSDEDDNDKPEDLSFNPKVAKSESLISPHSQNSQVQIASTIKEENHGIKYDSNANAVTAPMAQLPNGQFFSPTQIKVPQNLIFNDQRSVAGGSLVGQPQVLQLAQQEGQQSMPVAHLVQSMSQTNAGNHPPPPPLLVTSLPGLQLVNIRGPPPPLIHHGTGVLQKDLAPKQLLIPVSNPMTTGSQQQVTSPDSEGDSPNSRRKRKRIEDTTVFRDPPEQSLPFNGPNKYRFYCDVCDTGFTRKYTFNRHKCKGRVEKHYCQLCDKAYLSKYKLKDHILVKHEGQTVSCPECGKRFSSRSSMEMHKKQQHEGQYSIFCKICGKGFNHTGHYYGHMNKHTNTKPFWCQQCGKRFYGSSYLHNHKQVCRGNNELNFPCTICDRKFKCELYLKKHMKIHDNTPIIVNPNVAKATDEDLAKAGVSVPDVVEMNGGTVFPDNGKPVFPNSGEMTDSDDEHDDSLHINENDSMTEDSMLNDSGPIDGTSAQEMVQ